MLERTEGAPQTPVPTDDETYKETLRTMLRSGAISPAQAAEMWAAYSRDRSAAATAEYKSTPRKERASKRSYDNPRSPEEIQADMAELDVRLRGIRDDYAAQRAEKERGMGMPSNDGYEARVGIVPSPTAEMEQEGQDMADARAYGMPAGGGSPFRSQEEAAQYAERNVLSQAERNELAAQGMTPAEIVDRQRSGRDRDMAKSGISGSSGWAPVYVDGRVVYMERAPDDTRTERRRNYSQPPAAKPAPPVDRMQSWLHSTYPHSVIGFPANASQAKTAEDVPAAAPGETVPAYSDEPRHEIGMTNAAEGGRRTGRRVDSGEFSSSLGAPGNEEVPAGMRGTDRQDLRRRGYEQKTMQGPYGPERVWVKTQLGDELAAKLAAQGDVDGSQMTLEQYREREAVNSLRRRLMDRAGLSSSQAADMSVQNLRDLVRDKRASSEAERKEAARLARMAPRMRNEFELGRMGDDWRNAVAARQFGLQGPTPLGVQAAQAAQAMELAQRMVHGLESGDGLKEAQYKDVQRGKAVVRARELALKRGNKLTVADRAQIARQVEAEFPGYGQSATDALEFEEPLPLPEGHGNPGRVPEGTYPMF